MRAGEQVGGQRIAAACAATLLRGEVAGQAVRVQIGGQLVQDALPHGVVTQADRLAGLLLQTDIGVVGKPVAHARQAFCQRGLQCDLHAALGGLAIRQGQALRRRCQADALVIHLHQHGLLHRQRHGGDDALAHLQRIGGLAAGGVAGAHFPHDLLRAGGGQLRWGRHIPGYLVRAAGGNGYRLRLQVEQGGLGRHFDLHVLLGRVAQRDLGAVLVAFAHQRRQAADDLQILRGTDAGFASAEQVLTAVGYRHHLEAGEGVIQRHGDACLSVGIELHARVPEQQGIQQLACGSTVAAVTAGRHCLAAIVAASDDLHLRRGRFHAPGTLLEHGMQQVPGGVGLELQQSLVDGSNRHFGMGGWLAIWQFGTDQHLCLLAHLVGFLVGLHTHLQCVAFYTHIQRGHAQAEGGFAQVDQRRGRHVFLAVMPERTPPFTRGLVAPGEEAVPRHIAQAATQGQHADIDVGSPLGLDLQLDGRILAIQVHHFAVQNAFALHAEQGSGVAEGHAHLQLGRLAGLVIALLGQHVHAVVVFAAKPDLALARDGDAGAGFGAAAFAVGGAGDQFHFAGFLHLGVADQQAAAVALAAAQRAEFLAAVLVVIGVEAAHQTLATGDGAVRDAAHGQFDILERLAMHIECDGLEFQFLVDRDPIFGLDARHHGCRPDTLAALQGLDFAVGVAVAGFQRQVLRLAFFGNVGDADLPGTVLAQGECQTVGQQLRLAGRGVLVLAVVLGLARPAFASVEAEAAVVIEPGIGWLDAGGNLYRQAAGGAAVQIGQLHLHRQFGAADQRFLLHGGNAAVHGGQAELLHAELAAVQLIGLALAVLADLRHAVVAELGRLGNFPGAFCRLAAGSGGAPHQGQFDALIAAHVGDAQLRRHLPCCGQPAQRLGAQVVFHGYGFAGAQQGAVQHAVCAQVGLGIAAGRHVEAPAFDAAVPVAPDEGHIGAALVVSRAGADEQGAVLLPLPAPGRLDGLRMAPEALVVGLAGSQQLAVAAADRHAGIGHRLATVQARDPGQRAGTAVLEVHAQIGHQCTGTHIHGALLEARIEQVLAEHGRGDFQHMEARLQRNADHFKRARIAAFGLGKLGGLGTASRSQQRDHAGLHHVLGNASVGLVVAGLGQGGWQGLDTVLARLGALHQFTVIVAHQLVPADDFGIALGCEGAHGATGLQGLHGGRSFHLAQGDGQQCRAVRAFGKALDDAKRRGSKLGQRRHRAGAHGQREAVGVLQRAAGIVLEACRQDQLRGASFGQGGLEKDLFHAAGTRLIGAEIRFQCSVAAAQHNLLRPVHGHGCVEIQLYRPDRQAGRLRVGALATKGGLERRAYLELPALRLGAGQSAWAAVVAQRQRDSSVLWQGAIALQHHVVIRLLLGLPGKPARFQYGGAVIAADQAGRHGFANALHLAGARCLHAGGIHGAIEAQRERLALVDIAAAGTDVLHERGTRLELGSAGFQCFTRRGAEVRGALGGAAHVGGQVVVKIGCPGRGIAPGTVVARDLDLLVGAGAADAERGGRIRVAGSDGRLVEGDYELAHLAHFALWRDAQWLEGQCRAAGGQRQGRQGQAPEDAPGGVGGVFRSRKRPGGSDSEVGSHVPGLPVDHGAMQERVPCGSSCPARKCLSCHA